MPRTPLNADTAQVLANEVFGMNDDIGPLAIFNAIFELQNGELIPLDAGHEAAEDDTVTLAGIVGHCHFEGEEFSYCETIEKEGEDPREILLLAENAVGEMPLGEILPPTKEIRITEQFPSTLAVMAVWRTADGRLWAAGYRHPQVTATEAAFLLKAVAEEFSHEEGDEAAVPN